MFFRCTLQQMPPFLFSLERLQKQTIPLPITTDGKPDWEFMSDYIKTQSQIVFEEELKRLKSKLDE